MDEVKRACTGKHYWFFDRKNAEAQIRRMQNKRLKFEAYKCDFCPGWHLTTKQKMKSKQSGRRFKKTKDTPGQ